MLSYAIIVTTALLALFGAPWWSAVLGGFLLALVYIFQQQKLRARFVTVGGSEVLATSALASLASACITCGLAFLLGRAVGIVLFLT